ncbi:MAG TPA: AAA family ATPase, partial [Thermoguttaceae bacterium]|nr:AAA family ATPase [Thermoguttaceae bacterium]
MSMPLAQSAQSYLAAGLCVLPAIRKEKRPAIGKWKPYQDCLPTKETVEAWFAKNPDAICLLTGKASGNLELLDFDFGGELYEPWVQKVEAAAPGLTDRLVVETSQSGGWHAVYRCESQIDGNMKLAQRKSEDGSLITLIETRGNKGLFLCAPTEGYELVQGDFTELPVLTGSERETLLQAARELNKPVPETSPQTPDVGPCGPPVASGNQDRPGDDFNSRGDLRALLRKYGWRFSHVADDGNEHWTRPGKGGGTSATLKDGTFYVFSSNGEPFESEKPYSAFGVYAMLEHGGDFTAASRDLASQGYGGGESSDVNLSGILANVAAQGKEESAAKKKLQLVRADQLQMRPPEWLLRGVLERDTFALVFGDPGCGKSFLAIDWACRIATGTPWRGHAVQGGPVVYIAGEGQQGFGRR